MIKTKILDINTIETHCVDVSRILKVLAHPQRLLILGSLIEGPKTVTDIQDQCELSQSQLSQFLNRMKLEGLLDSRRDGSFVFYSIKDQKIMDLMRSIYKIYCAKE